MEKQEIYDRLRAIAALKVMQANKSLSVKTRVDAGIAKVRRVKELRAQFASKAKEL